MMLMDDRDLRVADIQSLSNADALAAFFLKLGYNVDGRIEQNATALGITSEALIQQINHIECIATQDDMLEVYLFEMRSLRVSDRQALARAFRNRGGDFLLVLTADYSSLDFVLLERIVPMAPSGDGSPSMSRRQVIVRPRVLTVERQNPGAVALRVLRRFTYTEVDPLAQHDKLLSAYTVAEWSEPLFNNRALFSDYYLKERLPDEPEWREDREPAFRALQKIIAPARQQLANATEADTRARLLEPIFEALGFAWQEKHGAGQDGGEPDYVLHVPGDDRPLAVCLAYVWNRYLDGVDPTRDIETPNENPGAQVVTLLERGDAPYAIVTNGKVWRLYAAAAHSRATNYYEIDLEETIASSQRDEAFPYFWLFFRAQAFVPHDVIHEGETRALSFLDRTQEGSQQYAAKLGENLKERVFENIFQHFAEGFIASIRQREGQDAALGQVRLDTIYQGTLTFLYRLMFLLYAESRALLPVQDVRGYYDVSLEKLRREIADQGGDLVDSAPDRLRKAYRPDTYDLYTRLTELFRVIDQGDPGRNVPHYNGGLFITEPGADSATQEQVTARFLRDHAIPDRYLAQGLDRLARDLDDKTKALVPIDFKSLGVRQLGSIYEGLLEFKLRIAPEKMAIVKGKRTEEIILYAQATKGKQRILTEGRGQNAAERTLPKGAVYLDNTRQERKATGSYYTPDYIVKYIVAHTVGPVLEEKFAALTPRLRDAERRYQTAVQNARAKSQLGRTEDPEKFWNSDDMLRLAYDALDVKVLDPAMGSGHFLVEAVDYITDRLLNFLNGFPRNPVSATLERTRSAILNAMEDQRVSIDAGQLNDVALLKRQVLKRCVYGVDLNHMAVELAKVSLWLDAFTLGAPLSFLDHHLRWGNSLIGAMARDADKELQSEQRGEERRQFTLFGGPFTGLLRSAEIMRGIGMLADATMEQAQESAHLFSEFEEKARPYKQLLDVFVIRHFGVKRADEFLRLYGAEVMTADPASGALDTPYKDLLRERQRLYEQHRFFHWDLEFPEVFIDLERAAWKENGGFDAVVGNPPYDELSEDALGREIVERFFLAQAPIYHPTQQSSGRLNWYHYFMTLGITLLSPGGQIGLIVPMSWMGDSFTAGVRRWMLEHHTPIVIEAFPQKDDPTRRIFLDAKLPTSIYVAKKNRYKASIAVRIHPGRDIASTLHYIADVSTLITLSPETWIVPLVSLAEWAILQKIGTSPHLGPLAQHGADPTSGEIIFNAATRPFLTEDSSYDLVLRGSHIQRYELADTAKQGEPVYLKTEKYLAVSREDSKAYAQLSPRIVYQEGSAIDAWRRVVPTYLPAGNICGHKICYFTNYEIDMFAFLAIYASNVVNWLVEALSVTNSLPAYLVGNLPFPVFNFKTPPNSRAELIAQARDLYARSERDGTGDLLAFTTERLAADETDVIHDLLAFLAQQMIDLNKQKQAEVRRFLGWLEGQIGAALGDLSGRTIIEGYLGDYQKSQSALPFADLYDRLRQNRGKLRANLSDKAVEARIAREYEASLGVLLPIKQQLAHTDRLIDQIVYQLYGLTDEEIAIVEGRG